MGSEAALAQVADEVRVCTRCPLAARRTHAVPGEGNLLSDVLLVGEGPGAREDATGRPCSLGALYTTIDRLESKGLIMTSMGDPTPQRGGRPKRMVRITAKGTQAAAEFYKAVMRVSRGVAWSTK